MTIKSYIFLHLNISITILLLFLLPLNLHSQSTTECYPPCRSGYICYEGECVSACNPPCTEGKVCNDSGECISIKQAQKPIQEKPNLLTEKPRKSRRKPIVAVITGSITSGYFIAGIILHSKRNDPYYEWQELCDDWKKETDPYKKVELKEKMDQAQDEIGKMKTRKRMSFILAGTFAIGFSINLAIPSRVIK